MTITYLIDNLCVVITLVHLPPSSPIPICIITFLIFLTFTTFLVIYRCDDHHPIIIYHCQLHLLLWVNTFF